MSTFTCHCGGTVTGTSVPDPARNNDPTWTFNCDNHRGSGPRNLLIVHVVGTPGNEATIMATMKDAIDANEQWLDDNPSAAGALITSTLTL